MEELELSHLVTLQEEGLTEQSLPSDFKPKFMSLQMMLGRYKNNPTEGLKESIEKASANLSHAIMDYSERDLPEEGVNPDGTPVVPPVPPVPPINEPPPPPPAPPVQQPIQAKKSNGVFDMFGW